MPYYLNKIIIKLKNTKGMTFIEIIIVISLIAMVNVVIYTALSNGLKVWDRNNQLVTEEDVSIFFDKLSKDLHSTFKYSLLHFKGNEFSFSFPTFVNVPADKMSKLPQGTYIKQLGEVEYYYDLMEDKIYRRQARYGMALRNEFGPPRLLVSSVKKFRFNYFYLTDKGEVYSSDILNIVPSAISVEVEFADKMGKKKMNKLIDIPIGN